MSLFQLGDFTLRSGKKSSYKIECDSLCSLDWAGIAAAIMEEGIVPPFSAVTGVPRGGMPLAAAMGRYVTVGVGRLLICEDVVTTGGSIERWRKVLENDPQTILPLNISGVCFIARGRCPDWVTPLFQMPVKEEPAR